MQAIKLMPNAYASAAGHHKDYGDYRHSKHAHGDSPHVPKDADCADTETDIQSEKPGDVSVLPGDDRNSEAMRDEEKIGLLKAFADSAEAAADKKGQQGGVDDPTARLTKRLVAAKVRDEVLSVMSEAYKAIGEALKAAAGGDDEAMEVVRRLNKLVRRVNRKLKDLDNEAELGRKAERARKKELEQLARQHELELKRRMAERKKREREYLDDPDAQDKDETAEQFQISFGAMSKEQLEAMIRQLMPAALSVVNNGNVDLSGIGMAAGADVMAGGEVEAAEGGEVEGEIAV